jgi:hypothetical protein
MEAPPILPYKIEKEEEGKKELKEEEGEQAPLNPNRSFATDCRRGRLH